MKLLSAESFYLLMAGMMALLAALYQLLQRVVRRMKWVEMEGVIIESKTAAQERVKKNSRRARLGYFIEDRYWESDNFVQIPWKCEWEKKERSS